MQPKKKKVATKKDAKKIAKKIADESELDEEHQLFCIYYLKYHNQVKAYMKVKPGTKYNSATVMASRWMHESRVQDEINRLKAELYADALLDPNDIVQKYIDIAFADITDYANFSGRSVSLKDSDYVDGSIVQEVTQGKHGISIKLNDRMKALDWLTKHLNIANAEQKAKIELIKAQIGKLNTGEDNEAFENDGFIEALNNSAKEDWNEDEEE
ncbi:terminase small subunit [Thomasclavelia spiroformis]|uniref:terminase small subunit n=1 Tax=Thomasclavelia spiroformis TaxID=29348 RepID=UPI00242D80E2|nr:terminase small subunit [Thomasclavelia spiroformis]